MAVAVAVAVSDVAGAWPAATDSTKKLVDFRDAYSSAPFTVDASAYSA